MTDERIYEGLPHNCSICGDEDCDCGEELLINCSGCSFCDDDDEDYEPEDDE